MEYINCSELEMAQKGKKFALMAEIDRRSSVNCILDNVYRFFGTLHPNKDEFQYLSDELYNISGTRLNEITPEEIELTIRAMLAGDDEYKMCERKMTFKGIWCSINRLFTIRYKCKKCEDQVTAFEKMIYIVNEIKEHPEMVEYLNKADNRPGIGMNIKDILT